MKSISSALENGLLFIIAMMVVADGSMFLLIKYSASSIQRPILLFRFDDQNLQVPAPQGLTVGGAKVELATNANSGWVVRYASRNCEFCRADEPHWNELASRLKELGYQVVIVVPEAKDEYQGRTPNGAQQESYVDVGWIKWFRLTATPTLLIFSPDQRLIWSHQGLLNRDDSPSAVRAVTSWRDSRK